MKQRLFRLGRVRRAATFRRRARLAGAADFWSMAARSRAEFAGRDFGDGAEVIRAFRDARYGTA